MNASTPTHATIEVDITEAHQLVQLDLNQIFGAIGLHYTVALESYGIVRVSNAANKAHLSLFPGAHAEVGNQTRLIVRADDGSGCTAAVIFKVVIVESEVDASRVA